MGWGDLSGGWRCEAGAEGGEKKALNQEDVFCWVPGHGRECGLQAGLDGGVGTDDPGFLVPMTVWSVMPLPGVG